MAARRTYATALDALGMYLEYKKAADVLINEIDGGFLLGYMLGSEQHVVTVSEQEIGPLMAEAVRATRRFWDTKRRDRAPLRTRLAQLGAYLDRSAAASIVVQERPHTFSVEYTGVPPGDLHGLARLYETLDDDALLRGS